jgi:hypothetical protein
VIQENAVVATKVPPLKARADEVEADRQHGDCHRNRGQCDHSGQ